MSGFAGGSQQQRAKEMRHTKEGRSRHPQSATVALHDGRALIAHSFNRRRHRCAAALDFCRVLFLSLPLPLSLCLCLSVSACALLFSDHSLSQRSPVIIDQTAVFSSPSLHLSPQPLFFSNNNGKWCAGAGVILLWAPVSSAPASSDAGDRLLPKNFEVFFPIFFTFCQLCV